MSENLTVGRRTSHFSLEKNRLLISFLLQKLWSKTSNTIWTRDKLMLEDGVDIQSLTQIVLDVLLNNCWRRNDINKRFFSNEKWLVRRPTVKFSDILNDF